MSINWINHPIFEGMTWEAPTKKGSVSVHCGPHGLVCKCRMFDFASKCSHTKFIEDGLLGRGMPNWNIA